MEQHYKVQREYKDTIFRMLYRDKKELLALYNGLNGTAYEDPDQLEVYTLDNAIYMDMKNDVSILVDSVLTLYEQQATVNPNMPLRDLIYVTRQFEKYIRNSSIYSTRLVKLPLPKFIVFYNGTRTQPDKQILKLSSAYAKEDGDPDLELKVTVLNINPGSNADIMEKCRTLKEYSMYVDRVRTHAKTVPIEEAVQRSVNECIEEGILAEFLKLQKAEVISMSIFEYNEEIEWKKIRRDEYELGVEAGTEIGKEIGKEIGTEIGIKAMVNLCRDLKFSREELIKRLRESFSLSDKAAAEYVEKFWQS